MRLPTPMTSRATRWLASSRTSMPGLSFSLASSAERSRTEQISPDSCPMRNRPPESNSSIRTIGPLRSNPSPCTTAKASLSKTRWPTCKLASGICGSTRQT